MSGYGSFPDGQTVRFERMLTAAPERIWEALTQAEGLSEWLGAGAIALEIGGAVELHSGGGPVIRGKVTALEPERLLAYSWRPYLPGLPIPMGADSEVRWELAPRGEQTLLTLTQTPIEADFLTRSAAGWHGMLDMLTAYVSGTEPPDLVPLFERVLPEYEKQASDR